MSENVNAHHIFKFGFDEIRTQKQTAQSNKLCGVEQALCLCSRYSTTLSLLKVTEAKVTLVQRRPFSILFLFFVYKYFVWRSIVQSNSQTNKWV